MKDTPLRYWLRLAIQSMRDRHRFPDHSAERDICVRTARAYRRVAHGRAPN